MNVSKSDIKMIQVSWEKVVPIADTAAGLFYDKLFELAPGVRSLFPDDLSNQGAKLMQTLGLVVTGLTEPDTITPLLQELGARHHAYGAEPEHYPVVGQALLWTLEQGLGENWNPKLAKAWGKAYDLVATIMKEAMMNSSHNKTTDNVAINFNSMVKNAPINIMYADLNGVIQYMNPASVTTLEALQSLLPVAVADITGGSFDVFHSNPSVQQKIIKDPKNMPYQALIRLGEHTLDLLLSALYDDSGAYIGPMVTWSNVTKQLATKSASDRLESMVENAPVNIMMTDLDFNVTYANPASFTTLRTLQQHLPIQADSLIGTNIDVFHIKPEVQRRILENPDNLPYQAKVLIGDETLDLLVSAIRDEQGVYIGPMVTWSVITAQLTLLDNLRETSETLAASAAELTSASSEMAASSEETSSQAENVASATEQADANVRTVASAVEEMSSSIGEIAKSVSEQSSVTDQAVTMAKTTNDTISKLGESSEQIGKVVKMITTIAQQTNLLALNATIEAARAGEAGKGFAVVANEVKELAKQTAKATDEISSQIENIQSDTSKSVEAIQGISTIIDQIAGISETVASATEEQSSTTTEIARNIQEVANGTQDISRNITSVAEAARTNGGIANNLQNSSEDLSQLAARLQGLVSNFKI